MNGKPQKLEYIMCISQQLLLISTLATGSSLSQADVLGTFTFDQVTANAGGTTDPTPPPPLPQLTFGSFMANGLGANPRASSLFTFSGWTTAAELDAGKYFETTLTPALGSQVSFDTITFGVRRSGTGPRDYVVRSSLDNFAANLPAGISPDNVELQVSGNAFHFVNDNSTTQPANVNGSTVSLGTDFGPVADPVTFRIYAYGAEQSGGTFGVDDVSISGAISPVPEPEEYAAMFAGSLGVFAWLRRRKNPSLAVASATVAPDHSAT
ncbi:MAG: PEP-CTERM sorting domain-containing protein [Pedosphaera sp.]|nr:PEP-CTERM sorting domain-containing protein [Pedosphaera sp.]